MPARVLPSAALSKNLDSSHDLLRRFQDQDRRNMSLNVKACPLLFPNTEISGSDCGFPQAEPLDCFVRN